MVGLLVVFLSTALFGITLCDDLGPVSLDNYFHLDGDLTKVTWAHAVNSVVKLDEALNGSVMMLEADVVLGQLEGSDEGANPLPIMAHPPATKSDLSLEQFITKITASKKGKGIKLDFKTKEVFAASENILEELLNKVETDYPFWLNADIMPGPVDSDTVPVDADYFLQTSVKKFPTAMLSIGWTTNFGGDITIANYTEEFIDNMTDALNRNHVIKPVTFAVRAGIAAQSYKTLTSLIQSSTSGTTLTIWSPESDPVDYAALTKLISDIGRDKIYIDLPSSFINHFNNSVSAIYPNFAIMMFMLIYYLFLCSNLYSIIESYPHSLY